MDEVHHLGQVALAHAAGARVQPVVQPVVETSQQVNALVGLQAQGLCHP